MGTRSLCGFRLNDTDYLSYNQYDGYPSGLGTDIVGEIDAMRSAMGWDSIKERVHALIVVHDNDKPTSTDIAAVRAYTNLNVGEQSTDDWYCLLRECQGTILKRLQSGYLLEQNDFIMDSLFCEWAYIVNLDSMKLEVYRGFQQVPDPVNRYGQDGRKASGNVYYPCKMIAEFPLDTVTQADMLTLQHVDEEE